MEFHQKDMARLSWYGLKPAAKKLMLTPVVNAPLRGLASLLPVSRRTRVPVGKPFVDYRLAAGGIVRMWDPSQCGVGAEIFWGGGRRTVAADQHAIDCAELLSVHAELFLDIGAYSGLFTLVAARANPKLAAHAYEIVPENYVLLVKNVVMNSLNNSAVPHLLGLADQSGEMRVPVTTGLSQLPSSLSLSSNFDGGSVIPLSTLDAEFPDFTGEAVFKIDVEGFEPHVLRGGQAFLARNKPHMVCEVLESMDTSSGIHEVLDPLEYRYYQFTDAGLVLRDRIKPTRAGRDWLLTVLDPQPLAAKLPGIPVS